MSPNLHENEVPDSNPITQPPIQTQQEDAYSIHSTTASPANALKDIPAHASHTHEPIAPAQSTTDSPDEIYDRLSQPRKLAIIAVLSFCGFLTPVSSTTVLAAVPEVAATYDTTGSVVNLSNAMYLICMGLSPCFWGPLSQVYGRRIVSFLLTGLDKRRGK